MKTVKIELLQGENSPLVFSTPVESNKLDEISGTLAFRIITLMKKARKYKMNIGFSFARKFDVRLTIDGVSTDGTNALLNGLMKFSITLQDNEKSMERFHGFIEELVLEVATGQSALEGTFAELLEEIELN